MPDETPPAADKKKLGLGCLGVVALVIGVPAACTAVLTLASGGGSGWAERTPEMLRGDAQVAVRHIDGYTAQPGFVGVLESGSGAFVCVDLLASSPFADDAFVTVLFTDDESGIVGDVQAGHCRPWREGLPDGAPIGG